MSFVREFRAAEDLDGLGGKGANLIRLRAAGFPVPDGFCIDVDGYRAFVDDNGLAPLLDALAERSDLRQPRSAREATAALAPALAAAVLPYGVETAVRRAYQTLIQRTRPGLPVAVRSSSLSEDSGGASAAGQYETYLGICDEDGVIAGVLDCYRSLWGYRAVQYRAMRGLDGRSEAMAVVVMEMVSSRVSGVTFTLDPISGSRDLLVINASWGLGEALVSGRVTPDHFILRKQGLVTLTRDIAEKQLEIVAAANGGTICRDVLPPRANQPSLTDEELKKVAELCLRAEQHYGAPQDIEWAFDGERLVLLQSRPVTTSRF